MLNQKKRTFIPADKELIPTHHIEKVAGKHFYAVDVEERYGYPLTASQFDHYPRNNNYEEILYEYKDVRGNTVLFPNYQGQLYQSFIQDKADGFIANNRDNLMAVPG